MKSSTWLHRARGIEDLKQKSSRGTPGSKARKKIKYCKIMQ
jgi:hypothetical protein